MVSPVRQIISARIRECGRITVAEFLELALYHPAHGYYSSQAQRSGRRGDFFTSVDAGPLFGACIARSLCRSPNHQFTKSRNQFDFVEAGAGNGRLTRDVLDALRRESPNVYGSVRVHLVERSAAARAAHGEVLADHRHKLASSGESLPTGVRGIIIANELLDALPCHLLTIRQGRLHELYVRTEMSQEQQYVLEPGPLSDPRLATYFEESGVAIGEGWFAPVSLAACRWIEEASHALTSGRLLIFDFGYDAPELYSAARSKGTLVRYANHRIDERWLDDAGECDVASHVNFTAVKRIAERDGLTLTRFTDQSTFLLDCGITELLTAGRALPEVRRRLVANTLVSPAGLGAVIKVMVLERREPQT